MWTTCPRDSCYLIKPGFTLPRQQWPRVDSTASVHCGARRKTWHLTDCGETQMMSHVIESCPLTKINSGLSQLHSADDADQLWVLIAYTRRSILLESWLQTLRSFYVAWHFPSMNQRNFVTMTRPHCCGSDSVKFCLRRPNRNKKTEYQNAVEIRHETHKS